MKGYVFTYGVDGFGADTAPAYEEGCYLNFDKAFSHLIELNHNSINNSDYPFYEDGYGIDYYPDSDTELAKAEAEGNWELFDKIMKKHELTDETIINKKFIGSEPWYGMYAIEEIEIKED